MPMLDEPASESSVQPLHRFAFDPKIGSFAPCVPYGGSAAESGTIAPNGRARGGLSPKTVRRICEYIDDHIGQRIRVENCWRSSRTCRFATLLEHSSAP